MYLSDNVFAAMGAPGTLAMAGHTPCDIAQGLTFGRMPFIRGDISYSLGHFRR